MSQTGKNVQVNFNEESSFNTDPGTSGGERLRVTRSPGLAMDRPLINSEEVRSDMLTTMARLGSRSVPGSYNGELSEGSYDTVLEAIMRGTWVAAVEITETEMTSITTTTSEIVAAAGSWITEGVRVGDVVVLTGHSTAANNDLNLRVTAVTASTITVAGTPLTTDASADSSFTLTILKKLTNPATPTRRSFWFEQHYADIDESALFGGVRFGRVRLSGGADSMAAIEIGVLGASQQTADGASAPHFTSPTTYTTDPLTFVDAALRIGGEELTVLTGIDVTLDLTPQTLPVIGSGSSPDVFDNELAVSGQFTGLREDLDNLDRLDNETEIELHVLLEEPGADPKGCISIFIPRIIVGSADAPLGEDGGMIETIPFTAGKKAAETGYDATMLSICTTAA